MRKKKNSVQVAMQQSSPELVSVGSIASLASPTDVRLAFDSCPSGIRHVRVENLRKSVRAPARPLIFLWGNFPSHGRGLGSIPASAATTPVAGNKTSRAKI